MRYARPGDTIASLALSLPSGRAADLVVELRAIATNAIVATPGAALEQDPGGVTSNYRGTITVPADAATGSYQVEFVLDGERYVDDDLVSVVAALPTVVAADGYPDAARLVAASSGEARTELDNLDEPQLEAVRLGSIAAVEEYCGQSFVPETKVRMLDGNGQREIMLPQRLAVLDTLEIASNPLALGDVTVGDARDRLFVRPTWGRGWLVQAQYEAQGGSLATMLFTLGYANIAVGGTWGWLAEDWEAVGTSPARLSPVEAAIRCDMEDAALTDAHQLGGTIRAIRGLGIRELRQGGLSVALSARPSPISPRAARLLDSRFVWQSSLGVVA